MLTYEPSAKQDLALYQWYEQLVLSGDMKKAFGQAYWSLSAFLSNFQEPTVLLSESDDKGFWFCLWAKPGYEGTADVHVWIREEKRRTKDALTAVTLGLTTLFQRFAMLMGITQDETIADEHLKLGFVRLGVLPKIGDGADMYINYLTRESFELFLQRPKLVRHG